MTVLNCYIFIFMSGRRKVNCSYMFKLWNSWIFQTDNIEIKNIHVLMDLLYFLVDWVRWKELFAFIFTVNSSNVHHRVLHLARAVDSEAEISLIEKVRVIPALLDTNHKDYSKKLPRKQLYKKILKLLYCLPSAHLVSYGESIFSFFVFFFPQPADFSYSAMVTTNMDVAVSAFCCTVYI